MQDRDLRAVYVGLCAGYGHRDLRAVYVIDSCDALTLAVFVCCIDTVLGENLGH